MPDYDLPGCLVWVCRAPQLQPSSSPPSRWQLLWSYKSLFCATSLVFLVMPLINRPIFVASIYTNADMQYLALGCGRGL